MSFKYYSTFSGYGGDTFALKRAGIKAECVGFSEIEKAAIKCYMNNHGGKNFGDVNNVDPGSIDNFDLLTGGFPCQPFSKAGKGEGMKDKRGLLITPVLKIVEAKMPKVLFLENVRNILSKRHEDFLSYFLGELDRIGYLVKYKVFNSAKHGTPQKRERVFFFCFRKDLKDKFDLLEYPEEEVLKIKAIDLLEHGVIDRDESLYITANYFKGNNLPGYLEKSRKQIVFADKILVPNATKLGYKFAEIGDFVLMAHDKSKTNRGRVQRDAIQTLTTSCPLAVVQKDNKRGIYFRMLTPKECFRFMGFFDDEINLEGLSNTQAKKLAGNGWEINLVSKLLKKIQETGVFEL